MKSFDRKLVKVFNLKTFVEEGYNQSLNYDDIGFNITNEWGHNNNVTILSHEYKLNKEIVELYAIYIEKQ